MERVKAITEDFLRVELRNTQPEVYYIPEGKILTPAAREYLQQRKIKVAAGGQPAEPAPAAAPAAQPVVPTVMCAPEPPKPKYVDYETGAYYMEKPEHMTHLYGNVLVDFVPDGTVYRIDGVLKAGETYVIHEVSAPGGYRVSEDQEFIMPLGQETKEIRFVNFAINGGGGGGGTSPGKRQLSIRKYDPVNQIGVAGAELTVYSVDGSLYLKGITDESGYLIFTMPTDGTYTYQETEAPAGYYLNPTVQYLYIKDGKVTNPENRTLYDYPNVEVILEKKDSEDGTAVPDTLLQVTDPDGQVVFHGRTDETGECKVLAGKAGTYRIVEIEPANGYERSEAPWQFLVSYDGTIAGETTLYNEKTDKKVGIGRIYAHYESTNGSSGSYGLGVPDWLKQPKAGDTTDSFKWYVLATIFAIGAGGLVFIGRRKGKKKDDEA